MGNCYSCGCTTVCQSQRDEPSSGTKLHGQLPLKNCNEKKASGGGIKSPPSGPDPDGSPTDQSKGDTTSKGNVTGELFAELPQQETVDEDENLHRMKDEKSKASEDGKMQQQLQQPDVESPPPPLDQKLPKTKALVENIRRLRLENQLHNILEEEFIYDTLPHGDPVPVGFD